MSIEGIAGGHALGGLGAYALLDGRDELPWHGAADDLVDELDAGAVRQRLDLDLADRVLAVPAGLLHMAAAPGRLVGERLPQGDLVRDRRRPGRRSGCAAAPGRRPRGPRPGTTGRPGGCPGSAPAASSGPRRPAGPGPARACPRRPCCAPGWRAAAAGRASARAPSAAGRPWPRGCRRSRPGSASPRTPGRPRCSA